MQKLIEGVCSFQQGVFRPQRGLFEMLANGQRPLALFISCSDSRISPNLITQTQPGELFTLRNAGNLIPPHGAGCGGECATIEFAVAELKVPDIIVCGHSHCGAMKALLGPPGGLDEMPATRKWLRHAEATRRVVREKHAHLRDEELLRACVEENVLVQIAHLRTHPVVASGLAAGTLTLHGWVYQIKTGEVFVFHPQAGRFVPLTQHPDAPAVRALRPVLAHSA